jgi:hypothetical protein
MPGLAETYLANRTQAEPETADLEPTLRGLCEEGRRAWPGIDLTDEEFVAHLARCCPTRPEAALKAADLYRPRRARSTRST